MAPPTIVVGTAGWSIPRATAAAFAREGSHLERYSRVFNGAEINSSFHRPHAHKVYAKWAALTPPDFRFAVKLPRTITHEGRLRGARAPFEQFLSEASGLGSKLGPLLVQLPPSLEFNARVARTFFALLRERHHGAVVCEARHASWFAPAAAALLAQLGVVQVRADPSPVPDAVIAAGRAGAAADGIVPAAYYRLHGSPRMYWSRYEADRLREWAAALVSLPAGSEGWCIFDNTASGAAAENALELIALTGHRRLSP